MNEKMVDWSESYKCLYRSLSFIGLGLLKILFTKKLLMTSFLVHYC